jgi:hypothetical protein
MDRVIPVLAIVALVGGWNLFIYKRSGGRAWSPMWIAFSAIAAAVFYVVAGLIGYTLDRHDRFIAHNSWTGHAIWSEILDWSLGWIRRGVLLAPCSYRPPAGLANQSNDLLNVPHVIRSWTDEWLGRSQRLLR